MLVSRTETLAHELRRQDLLTRALQEKTILEHRPPAPARPIVLGRGRQVVGTALICLGRRLADPAVPVAAKGLAPQ